jgi:hypothetical protein
MADYKASISNISRRKTITESSNGRNLTAVP